MAHFKPGQVHYTTLEGIPEGAPVMTGTFSVNNHLVVVLFDSGASHTFISKEYASRLGWKWKVCRGRAILIYRGDN